MSSGASPLRLWDMKAIPTTSERIHAMRYMLLIYDNADTRDAFFGPGSEPLGAEIDALLKELRGVR